MANLYQRNMCMRSFVLPRCSTKETVTSPNQHQITDPVRAWGVRGWDRINWRSRFRFYVKFKVVVLSVAVVCCCPGVTQHPETGRLLGCLILTKSTLHIYFTISFISHTLCLFRKKQNSHTNQFILAMKSPVSLSGIKNVKINKKCLYLIYFLLSNYGIKSLTWSFISFEQLHTHTCQCEYSFGLYMK